jgi:PIN domain nuclease of toxin-antitoxin system
VRILLDTHIALWAITDSPQMPRPARDLVADPANDIVVSAASVWEIAIKHGLGRGSMPVSGADALSYFREAGYRLLTVSAEQAAFAETLPPIHSDPFDRILVAQALCEPMRLLTHDRTIARYSDSVILV